MNFVVRGSAILRVLVTVLLTIRKRNRVDCSQIDVLEPGLNTVLVIVKTNRSIRGPHHQIGTLDLEHRN